MLFSTVSFFFFSSRRRHTRLQGDWSSDVCSSDLMAYRQFLPWSVAAAILWGAGSALAGYAIGRNSERLSRFGERSSLGILVLVVVLAGLYLLRRRLGKKRRRRRRAAIRRAVPVAAERQ